MAQLRKLFVAVTCGVTACTSSLFQRPGIFFDVHLQDPPPSTLCLELARRLASETGISVGNIGPLQTPGSCSADLGAAPLYILIGTDPARRLLLVNLTQRDGRWETSPSPRAQELGNKIAQVLHEEFPNADIKPGKRFQGIAP
jgi:hypothetical protein